MQIRQKLKIVARIIILSLIGLESHADAKICIDAFSNESALDGSSVQTEVSHYEILASWRDISKFQPANHNQKNFVYVIHAVSEDHSILEDRLENLAGRTNISASLIRQDYVHTFADYEVGLILQLPPENIVATSPVDMGGITVDQAAAKFGIDTPNTLLSKSIDFRNRMISKRPDGLFYNEIRFNGTKLLENNGGQSVVKIIGLFYLKGLPPNEIDWLKKLSKERGLPLIQLRPDQAI